MRFDGKLSLLDTVVPAELGINLLQRVYWNPVTGNYARVALWTIRVGTSFSKPADGDITLGAYIVPWGIRIEAFSFGVGIGYRALGKVASRSTNWFFMLPLTYSLTKE